MTPTTVPVPVPYREGDGGTVHKCPQGTVWGRLGTVHTVVAAATIRGRRRGSRGEAAEARRCGKEGCLVSAQADNLDANLGGKVRMGIRSISTTAESVCAASAV